MDNHPSLDEILADPGNRTQAEIQKLRDERLLGTTAVLLFQSGHLDAAALLADVSHFELDDRGQDWNRDQYMALIDVEPPSIDRFTEEIQSRICDSMREVADRDHFDILGIEVRPTLPKVGMDWRNQLRLAQNGSQTNHARRVRLESRHPIEDGLHFTNEWEYRVYVVLKEHQATLPDNDTIGIIPLSAIKIRDHVFEPDFLITYRGRAGIIEVDGPYHRGKLSDDKSRDRLLRHSGVKHVDRIDVQDATQKNEVHKFVIDFLRQLES
ncbi:MAG: hypothetical protein HOW97_21630 [Catenulispora sp.]|nr:hypothetical protein [Catenulispora sp.]